MRLGVLLVLVGVVLLPAGAGAEEAPDSEKLLTFNMACDASAAALLKDGRLLVAENSNNILKQYPLLGGAPLASLNLYEFTEVTELSRRNTSAIEGATRVGDRLFWITSHAREKTGRNRPNRRRFFALKTAVVAGAERVAPDARAYKGLSEAIEQSEVLKSVRLQQSVMVIHSRLPHLAPTKKGLNIEGLAAAKDGKGLLIGLRNPRRGNSALVIPVHNPLELIRGTGDPDFGSPIVLALDDLTIASMEYSHVSGSYYIVAGPHDKNEGFKLFEWSGEAKDRPVLLQEITPADFVPRAMVVSDDGKRILLLSDDGDIKFAVEDKKECQYGPRPAGQCRCTWLVDKTRKSFRGKWIEVMPAQQ